MSSHTQVVVFKASHVAGLFIFVVCLFVLEQSQGSILGTKGVLVMGHDEDVLSWSLPAWKAS